jgi:hypothetical protein
MKAIKVTSTQPYDQLTTPCSVRPGVMVGSFKCQGCKDFDAYDEGKGTVVLSAHPDQEKGAFVYDSH